MKTPRERHEEKVITRLFYVLREQYGGHFVTMIGDEPKDVIKARWLEALKDFTTDEIGKALKEIKSSFPEKPPNMRQFATYVKNFKHCKIGHGSNKIFDYGEMSKTTVETGREHLKNIRAEL